MEIQRNGVGIIAGAILAICVVSAHASDGVMVAPPSQPLNVGDAILAAAAYHDEGAYEREVARIANLADEWMAQTAPSAARPALVLDVDETALSNWEVIRRDNFGRPIAGPCVVGSTAPCGWASWDLLASSTPIAPIQNLARKAQARGIAVFFITGRPENQREATERNLRAAGYTDFVKLYMVPDGSAFASAVDFKAPVRAAIEAEGYTIIANIGDQPSDLFGGNARKIFLLPNPFYRVP